MSVETFVGEVREYVGFVQAADSLPLRDRFLTARVRLLTLYSAALRLPVGATPAEDIEPPTDDRDDGYRTEFGNKDQHWEGFDPYEHTELVAPSLGAEVREIYDDVIAPLRLWDAGHTTHAIWHWRFGFDSHWGHHAIDALHALHHALAWHGSAIVERAR